MKGKRRTFSERIAVSIIFFFILHTVVVAAAALLILWQFVFAAEVTALTAAVVISIVSAVVFSLLLRRDINQVLFFTLGRIISMDRSAPRLDVRQEDLDSKENVEVLYANFSEVIRNFNTLQMDIGALADDHLKGVYTSVIDESKYKGATLEVVRRVNAMADINKGLAKREVKM
jgi:hypothetical protein